MGEPVLGRSHSQAEQPQKQSLSASHSMERSMGGFLVLLLVTLITPLVAQEYQCDPTPNGLSDNCIGCICEASTRCNATTKCISGGSFCGPFLLSKPFWVDGGSCVLEGDSPGDQGAWRRCALDIICSANTIRSYINRFGKVIQIKTKHKYKYTYNYKCKCYHNPLQNQQIWKGSLR